MYPLLHKNRATSHELFKFSSMRLPFDVIRILLANNLAEIDIQRSVIQKKIITTLRDRQDEDEPAPLLEILGGRVAPASNLRTENGANKKIYDSQQSENASAEPHFEKENSAR